MDDRLDRLGGGVVLAVIGHPLGLYDQAVGVDAVGRAGHQGEPILPVQDAQGFVQGLEIILGDHGQDVLDPVGVDLAQDVQVDHVPFFQLVDVAEQPRRGQTTVGCQHAVGVFAAHRQGRTGQVPGAHLQYAVVGAVIDGDGLVDLGDGRCC